MWSIFTFLDAAIALYFFYFFPNRLLGYLVAAIIVYRIAKDLLAGRDEVVLDFRGRRKKKKRFTTV